MSCGHAGTSAALRGLATNMSSFNQYLGGCVENGNRLSTEPLLDMALSASDNNVGSNPSGVRMNRISCSVIPAPSGMHHPAAASIPN